MAKRLIKTGSLIVICGALSISALLSAAPPDSVADAAQLGDRDAVKALLKQAADVNAAQGDGMTALHWAALNGDVKTAAALLTAKANVEVVTRMGGYTPLHLAALRGHGDIVVRLLASGALIIAGTLLVMRSPRR